MRIDIKEVIRVKMRNNEKINMAKLARQYNCDYRTVKAFMNRDSNYQRKKRKVPKITDGLESVIEDKYINHCAPAIEIYKVLKNNYGYKGSYSTIKRFTHSLKNKKVDEVTIHFETAPGKQCQIDWKERLRLINKYGEVFTVDIFLAILGYSRLKFIKLTTDKTQKTLFRCLGELFRYLDGVPKELLFDNMRTVVDRSRTQFDEPIYNDKLVSFSKDAGFIPKSCVAFRPRTKGKVETLARIVNRLKAYNNEFETFEDLERIVDKLKGDINNEIHSVTSQKPSDRYLKEKEYLNPMCNLDILEAYYSDKVIKRKVPKDCLITYQRNRYSIPPQYVGKEVSLILDKDTLHIYYNQNIIATHNISNRPINYQKDHYVEILKRSLDNDDLIEKICEENLEMFGRL